MVPLLTPPEAAEYLHVAVQTLAKWRRLRKGPRYYKLGWGLVRYHREELEAWVQATQPPAPPAAPDAESVTSADATQSHVIPLQQRRQRSSRTRH